MKNNFFAFLNRMKYINRWGLMRNNYVENIQEHSLQVAIIAHGLAVIRNKYFGGNIDARTVATVAMFHDASEIITGDMPTPVKYYNTEIISSYKDLEAKANEKIISFLPEEMREEYKELFFCEDEEVRKIIKAADKLGAYIKCIEETNAGNGEFATAKKTLEKWLEDCNIPEVAYFIEHFMKGFSLTLDEM
ncbi:MAG: 5'-deoxynucleotidase [Bacillota bacterium]|nr:5'-deoxynucleotidase [Bacillota bacterium]